MRWVQKRFINKQLQQILNSIKRGCSVNDITLATGGNTSRINIEFHQGGMLMKSARFYSTVAEAILEGVQNAIDVNAKRIEVKICRANRSYQISDNGDGVTTDEFSQSLKNIGMSVKDEDKFGRFGLGLVSPVGKCERMHFISISKTSGVYNRWTFVTDEIKDQPRVSIPRTSLRHFRFDPKNKAENKKTFWWRTKVSVEKYTSDKKLSEIDIANLRDSIADRFGKKIKSEKIDIRLIETNENNNELQNMRVTIKGYSDQKIAEYVSDEFAADCGIVRVRLFIAKKNGRIVIGDAGNNRVLLTSAGKSAVLRKNIGMEVYEALTSGYFEGEITCDKLNLNPDRKGFEENDAMVAFGLSVHTWWEKIGNSLYKIVLDTKTQDRYQELGVRALQSFEKTLSNIPELQECLDQIKSTTIGIGNASPSREDDGQAIGTRGGPFKERREKEEGDGSDHNDTKTPQKKLPINSVHGPSGTTRRIAKSRYGISITYNPAAVYSELWRFDIKSGEVEFNLAHQTWADCANSDRQLTCLIEDCVRHALSILLLDEQFRGVIPQSTFDTMAKMFVGSMKNGSLKYGGHH